MKVVSSIFVAFFFLCLVSRVFSGCSGSPPTYNGLPCASTTRYWDTNQGACGCGSSATSPYAWNGAQYTAAASQALFDESGSSWCGAGCGECYQLTPTGDCPTGSPCATNTNPITVMITNLCPYDGNAQWCPNPGGLDNYGYPYHFDLRDPNMAGWVDSLGWNNPVVTMKRVACGSQGSPNCTEAATCECTGLTAACSSSGSAATSTSTSTHATTATSTSTSTHATSTSTSTSTSTHSTSTSASSSTSTHSTSTSTASSSGTSGCHATVSTTLSSSWSGGGQVAITVTNTGTSPIKSVDLAISGSPSVFNLVEITTGNYNLASYAFPLAVSGSFTGGGFTYSGSEPSVSLSTVGC